MTDSDSRKAPTELTKLKVWAAAAGRCTLCNCLVLENETLGELINIGELAHNVGWGKDSPRGESDLDSEARREAENLILLCRNCHKPIDQNAVADRYTVQALAAKKREHEQRVRFLTSIGPENNATILRLVGDIRTVPPQLTYDIVLSATTAAGFLPMLMPGAMSAELELDLRGRPDQGSANYFSLCAAEIDELTKKVNDGVRRDIVERLAVFAFARIPLLIHLGARLDDKVSTIIFQRQRADQQNAWTWPDDPGEPPSFEILRSQDGKVNESVALILNLSGTISFSGLPSDISDSYSVYEIAPTPPLGPGPTLISGQAALIRFDRVVREFLAMVEESHGKIARIELFGAVPLSAAVTLGRVLMPDVSPAWSVWDRNDQGSFIKALEIRR